MVFRVMTILVRYPRVFKGRHLTLAQVLWGATLFFTSWGCTPFPRLASSFSPPPISQRSRSTIRSSTPPPPSFPRTSKETLRMARAGLCSSRFVAVRICISESCAQLLQAVTIDGEPWHSNCYLDWDVFVRGSTIELELTNDINTTCGEGPDALPPSLSTGGYSGSM